MFDRPSAEANRAILVQLDFGQPGLSERLSELRLLAESAGAEIVGEVYGPRRAPDPALFAGSGKVAEIGELAGLQQADIIIFNHELSAAQQRNLERALARRVIDCTALILDIFALRAKSHEGKLQVELAQLEHLSTRLIRGWTHLERQKGGIGLRGPGETQLETDRRLLGKRVKLLKERLRLLERQRQVRRRGRERRDVPTVSLVGYTNAGKSTLFNAVTKAGAYAADQLFATLDTTSRRVYLGEAGAGVVLSDTVGFIRELPHSLVEAFHATLEETAQADLLLHVVDAASPDREAQIEVVNAVLAEIGAGDVSQILVWNKLDLTHGEPAIELDAYGKIERVLLSARTGAGLGLLRQALANTLYPASAANAEPPSDV
ncbi:MAG: GTPase HflX [Candidatus Dactylopiibacterium carminicum]|uniref:GTPase HflX n=1 Tax=Candidatus Dactylopiibacterium carminicum TaxID=857335 RepID=A0A272EZB0_9RHOO|nr:GTPase HflX [Candidatus Dactylopiibacterium carminicum]KAF7600877.1 GTPase HflX [Candidatus Dactylopiibacterium carminicum]PAS95376.1 MAG: GTPase HflX [Candidatus Dactylopiibacterium carminicum]PAT00876.1 MAG: GTPase HflX [Candidatus Dactylopiibacterium carminicum]